MRVNRQHQTTIYLSILPLLCLIFGVGCQSNADAKNLASKADPAKQDQAVRKSTNSSEKQVNGKVEIASFGAGCFWCVEAVFQELDGVISVKPGYMGGVTDNPTYEDVCRGNTGHAEICQISYDPAKIKFKELLEVFWKTHDPTTLNRQGADRGTQYRSAIFYHSDEQKELALNYKNKLNELNAFPGPVVTEITKASTFYTAEKYHENYYKQNPNAGYCRSVIRPKMDKFRKAFSDKLKKDK